MPTSFVDKVKGFLMAPTTAFQDSRADTLGEAFRYYFILLVIFSILYAIVSTAIGMATFTALLEQLAASGAMGETLAGLLRYFSGFVIAVSLFFVYLQFLLMLFGIFLSGFIYHVFVLLLGGEKGYVTTVKTIMYASTPWLLLGWIPYVSIIGALWYLILLILGIKETQEITLGSAILVILVPLVLLLIFVMLGAVVIAALVAGFVDWMPFIT
jgi:hypothetical protein